MLCKIRVAFAFVLLSACATAGGFKKQMNSWLGSDVNQMLTSWGPPSQTFAMPNGSTMYSWLYVGGTQITANYNQYLNMVTASSRTVWCQVSVTTDQGARVSGWQARGNACRAR